MRRYLIHILSGGGQHFYEWTESEFAFEQLTQAHMKAGALSSELGQYTCVRDMLYDRILAVYNEQGIIV